MNVSLKSAVLGFMVVLATSSAYGQIMFTWTGGGNNVTLDGTFGDADARAALPAGTQTFRMLADMTSDMLLVDAALTVTKGTWFNQPVASLGSDTNPGNPALFDSPGFGGLTADSWATTPNAMSAAAGTNMLDTAGTLITHFDSTDDGPQTAFQFAQITITPDENGDIEAVLEGTIQTAASPTPVFDTFTYNMGAVPEPTSLGLVMTSLLGGLAMIRRKRNK